jgi:WhiB family redox-sensing transcriptional regulator
MTITTTKPLTGACPTDLRTTNPHTTDLHTVDLHTTHLPTTDIDGPSHRDRSTRPGLPDRSGHRPSLSTTIEREHVVFTRSPALERECTSVLADHTAGQIAPQGAIGVSDDDHFLLDQPQHVADRLPCRTQNADLWFAETPAELDQAKEFCSDCPARRACLAGAVARREQWCVWGGEIFDRGAIIARKRPRGRPRKDEVAA